MRASALSVLLAIACTPRADRPAAPVPTAANARVGAPDAAPSAAELPDPKEDPGSMPTAARGDGKAGAQPEPSSPPASELLARLKKASTDDAKADALRDPAGVVYIEFSDDGMHDDPVKVAKLLCSASDFRDVLTAAMEVADYTEAECDDAAGTCSISGTHDDPDYDIETKDGRVTEIIAVQTAVMDEAWVDRGYRYVGKKRKALSGKRCR